MTTLRIAQDGTPGSLDPYLAANVHSHEILWAIVEPLFTVDGKGQPVDGGLARVEKVNDLTYRLHLRENVTFHQAPPNPPEPLDAAAVIANLQHARGVTSARGRIVRDLIDFDGLTGSGQVVTIPLKYERVDLLYVALMTSPASLGTPRPLGTGPFQLASPNNPITLAANAGHRDGPPQLDSITFEVIADPGALANALDVERIDHVRIADPPVLALIGGNPKFRTPAVRPLGTYYLGFNANHPLLTPKVRWAFGQAIDLPDVARRAGLTPTAGPIPQGVEGYDQTPAGPQHDQVQARKVLQDAGLPPIPLLYSQDSHHAQTMAPLIRDFLVAAGQKVDLRPFPTSRALVAEVMNLKQQGAPYAVIHNWLSILPAAELFLRPLFESEMRETNLTGYAGVDAILREARRPMAEAKRLQLYVEALARIVLDAPAIFLGNPPTRVSAQNVRVSGLDKANLNVQSFPVDRFHGVDVS